MEEEPTPDYVSYRFEFWEDGAAGEVTEIPVPEGPEQRPDAESGGGRVHTVRKGETLWGIARKHGVGLTALIAANPQIKNPNLIYPAGFIGFENGKMAVRGIVDDFTVEMDAAGVTATITGRGFAARLLDNESRPVTYQDATLEEIIRRHVLPYGVTAQEIADIRAGSVYTVPAGISQWKVLEDFCRTYGGFTPRFSVSGALVAAPERTGACRHVSIGDSETVLACSWREDHYGVLTEALVIDKKRNVSYAVQNPEMIAKGGQCRRVVYTPGQSTWAAMRYTGRYQIERSREEERS